MAINLEKIYLDTKGRYKLSAVGGKNGLDKILSWVHYMEDSTTTDFIRGGELIITTGLKYSGVDWLESLIKKLIERKAAGIVVNIGNYIREIPQSVINICDENDFAIFTMPWEIHLVDIMQDYANKIIHEAEKDVNISNGLLKAMLHPHNREDYIYALEEGGYNVNAELCAVVIKISQRESENIKNIIARYTRLGNVTAKPYEVTIVFRNMSTKDVRSAIISLNTAMGGSLCAGIGDIVHGVENLSISYKHAEYAVFNREVGIYSYEDIGINKILLEIEDKAVLKDIFDKYLGVLYEYDSKNKTEYMGLLRKYIDLNSSVAQVAEETFTHRNTINYRIKKIKDILCSDLDDAEYRFYLKLSFYIHDIIFLVEK